MRGSRNRCLILVPLFLALRMCYGLSWRRTAGYLLFSVYLAAVDSVVGLPSITYIRFSLNLNLEPFAYMFSDYVTSLLNVILFTPLGLLLPLFCSDFPEALADSGVWAAVFPFH